MLHLIQGEEILSQSSEVSDQEGVDNQQPKEDPVKVFLETSAYCFHGSLNITHISKSLRSVNNLSTSDRMGLVLCHEQDRKGRVR